MDTDDCEDYNGDTEDGRKPNWSTPSDDNTNDGNMYPRRGKKRKKRKGRGKRKGKGKGKRGWHRRRLRHNTDPDILTKDDEHYDKCASTDGWNHRRRLADDGCHNSATHGATKHNMWYNHHDKGDEDDEATIINEVCLTYNVNEYYEDCGDLESIFLPLCESNKTDFNSSQLTPDDLTAIITEISPKSLDAEGITLYGELGIIVDFTEGYVDQFELCLANVSVEDNYYHNQFDKITVANWVVFQIDGQYEGCTNNDGLPCLS